MVNVSQHMGQSQRSMLDSEISDRIEGANWDSLGALTTLTE
jgi:hypothetical protein